MFRFTKRLGNAPPTVPEPLAAVAVSTDRQEAGLAASTKCRPYSGVLPRAPSSRGWKATFMAV